MKPLGANMKQLYQYRFMWIFHIIAAVFILFIIDKALNPNASNSRGNASYIFLFIYGEMISLSLSGTLSKPCIFCLPNHLQTVKKIFMIIWMVIATICLLPVFVGPLFGIPVSLKTCIAHMGIMSFSFSLGAVVCIRQARWAIFPIWHPVVFLLLFPKTAINSMKRSLC